MQMLPGVAICGRPNVGKSSLFNVLAGKRISIVDPTPGVTRDRISTFLKIRDKCFELIDTGGIGIEGESEFGEEVFHQVELALERASIILFMVDIQEGIAPLDHRVAELLRRKQGDKLVWVLANKADEQCHAREKDQFRKLGFGEPLCTSAAHHRGIDELEEMLYEHLPLVEENPADRAEMKIAVVGRVNVGKSTFINSIAAEDRVIISEIPGTTRDSVDVCIEKDGRVLIAIDTAGLKKAGNVHDSIEFYSQARTQQSIRRADVVILMMDAVDKISAVDKQIAQTIREDCKPAIIVINKWDLVKSHSDKTVTTEDYERYITDQLPELGYVPIIFITAKTGKNVSAVVDLARSLMKRALRRISTGELNRLVQKLVSRHAPPLYCGKQGKLYYATQAEVVPPTFIMFVNRPEIFTTTYQRYLFREFQRQLGFKEIPIRFWFKEREREIRGAK